MQITYRCNCLENTTGGGGGGGLYNTVTSPKEEWNDK